MGKHLIFEVLGTPQGKGRARVTRWGTYTPEKTVMYENLIKVMFQEKYSDHKPTEKYLSVKLEFIFEPPKSASKKKTKEMIEGIIKPAKKPDIDNCIKAFADALNGIAYKDDVQIIRISASKKYGTQAKTIMSILEVD